jgi:energy-converting hydrogenase B subunit D
MSPLLWTIDVVLVLALLVLAIRVLTVPDLFEAVVFFIAFGLFMALAWVRLEAPDLALAEAAIGAGMTGVLLLDAVRFMKTPRPLPPDGKGLGR